ncbi:MAG: hypothetical protein KC496_07825, partial [Anaerolineae bacterium]|nr:hypothetical protein [Anaerolineae bacterium]
YTSKGEDDMVPVKMLDLMRPVDVLVYDSLDATQPLAVIRGIITPNANTLPERLRMYANTYPTLEAWQKAR